VAPEEQFPHNINFRAHFLNSAGEVDSNSGIPLNGSPLPQTAAIGKTLSLLKL
jgi:hypothetical protein